MVVKRGQHAVIEGKATLRLFMAVEPGIIEKVALARADNIRNSRQKVKLHASSKSYEYFT